MVPRYEYQASILGITFPTFIGRPEFYKFPMPLPTQNPPLVAYHGSHFSDTTL